MGKGGIVPVRRRISLMLAALCLALSLSACSLLEGEYSQVEPHADRYWESAADDILRAESYQDLVNIILLLIEGQEPSGVVRLYLTDVSYSDAWDLVEQACDEVREETPVGSYSLHALDFSVEELRDSYYQVALQPVYRRTKEELESIVETSSSSAIYDMVLLAWERGEEQLTVRYTYASEDELTLTENILLLQQELEVGVVEEGETPPDIVPWEIHFYPPDGDSSIIEIFFHPQKTGEAVPPAQTIAPAEGNVPAGADGGD